MPRPPHASRSAATSSAGPVQDASSAAGSEQHALPAPPIRSLITVGLIAHGFLLLVTYASVVEPSEVESRLQRFFSWYLQPLHLQVDNRPIYFLHTGTDTASLRFERRALPTGPADAGDSDAGWQPLPAAGWAGGERHKRYLRWAAMTAGLAGQQKVGLAGLLARNLVADEDIQAVRLVTQDNAMLEQFPYFEREAYRAAVVHEAGAPRFVELNERRQNALTASPAEEPADE